MRKSKQRETGLQTGTAEPVESRKFGPIKNGKIAPPKKGENEGWKSAFSRAREKQQLLWGEKKEERKLRRGSGEP